MSSSVPFVVQGQLVKWQVKIPYRRPHLSSTKANKFDGTISGWCWSSNSDYFQNFCRFLLLSSGDIQARRRTRFFSARKGRSSSIAWGNVVVIPFYRFQDTEVLLMLLMPFLFFLNDRSRWLGYWSAEWCSARTKLVSYLYFTFISYKR